MTTDEMRKYIYNPHLMQKYVLDKISDYNGGENLVSDPSNPFVFLLEATCANASNSILEANSVIRKKYPSLANSEDEIMHHLNDEIINNIFSTPSEAIIDFYISVPDLSNNGYRPPNVDYVQTTIPVNTKVTALDVTFILLNPIVVRLYDNGSVFVEQQLNNDNDLAYTDISTLQSTIYNTDQTSTFIVFRTKMKQLDIITVNKTAVVSNGFKTSVKYSDYYCFSNVTFKSNNTNGYKYIRKCYNDEYIDPQTPHCFVSVYEGEVVYRIPDVYLMEGLVSGNINIDTYVTKGKIYNPLNRLMPTDFTVTLGDTSANESTATSEQMGILAASSSIVDGGTNGMSYEDIKSAVINNSFVTSNLPITDNQLTQMAKLNGYSIFKSLDVITNREYLALKSLPDITNSALIFAKQDVFFNTVKLTLSDLVNHDSIVIQNSYFVIKSNTIFKNDNGIVTIITPEQKKYLTNLTRVSLIEHLANNKYYYNPYYYIIETDESFTTSKVYDLDKPDITSYRIMNKNESVIPSVNIDKYRIDKVDNGYKIIITLEGSSEFTSLDQTKTKIQLKIPLFNDSSEAFIDGVYSENVGGNQAGYEFLIKTNFILDTNDMFTLENGYSVLYYKKFNLDVIAYVYTMTYSDAVVDETQYLLSEVYSPTDTPPVIFTKECMVIKFGTKLDYIYNNLFNVYSERKYKTYDKDVPATYSKNVYQLDPKTGSPFKCNKNVANHQIEFNLLHNKGDIILDEKDQPVLLHKQGDNVLDENGNLIVDVMGGIIRYIDILMLEYEFLASNSVAYSNYRNTVLESLYHYLTVDLQAINDKLLENTRVMYKSYKSVKNVDVKINAAIESIAYNITPEVTLYITNVKSIESNVLESYKTIIGHIINKHLDNTTIKLEHVKQDIKSALGNNIASVKIVGMDPSNNEVITLKNENAKLTLGKILSTNTNNEIIVKYDISLNVQYI